MKKWLCLMLSMALIFGMTSCGTGQDEGLVLTEREFFEVSDVSKVNVVYANAEGIWRDLQTANELIVIK